MKKIIIYSSNACPYCVKAKNLFESKGVEYQELRVDKDPALVEESIRKSGGMRTVPQIFIDDYHVGGCDELYALEKDNKLDPLLKD